MLRAFGALEQDAGVRNPDFLARSLVADGRGFRALLRLASRPRLHAGGKRVFEWMGPGTYWLETARVKHFDRLLLEEVGNGVGQVVVLGAGLDSGPYRFAEQLQGVRVIEVDHPEMATFKRERVQAALGSVPEHVTYLPCDLMVRDLGGALAETDFDPEAPVLVLWAGVSMFLSELAIGAILRWTAERPPLSSIAFDYLDRGFFEERRRFSAAGRMRRMIELSGERYGQGFDRAGVPRLMRDHGLEIRSHLSAADLGSRYLRRGDGSPAGELMSHFGYVHAESEGLSPAL